MRQKIVQVVTQMEAGGAQRVALLLHQEMLRRGVASELWFLYAKTSAFAGEPGVRSLWPARPRYFELPLLWLALSRALRDSRPHALISHTHYANAFAQPLAKLLTIPLRLAVHHNALTTYPAPARILERWLKRIGAFTSSVAVSEDVRSSLLQASPSLYSNSTRRIYNGIPGFPTTSDRTMHPLHPPLDRAREKILFNVGRLTEQKNQQALIAALKLLPDCVAVIAGRGPLEEQLRRQARTLDLHHRLHLLGEIDNVTVAQWMRRSDVFVFPSRFEAMPMALLEAMRNRMTIVASDISAHREIAGDAVLLTGTEPEALAATIRLALQQPDNRLGDRACTRSHDFTVEAMTDSYLEIL
jgi:glycosyltransferase involved in cell wall biosynthesis